MGARLVAVIDDQADIRHAACLLLESHGFLTKGCASGETFLADVHKSVRVPDCIVTDLFVTDSDGTAIVEMLQSVRTTATIILTGDPSLVPPCLVKNGRLRAVLKKPAPPEVLIQTIEDAISAQ